MKIKIIECSMVDLPELSNLWHSMIMEVLPDAAPNKTWWIDYIKAFMVRDDYKCYKAVVNDIVVGFIDGSLFADPSVGKVVAVGLNFYVLPEYRGNVGTRLYLRLVRDGKARGASFVDLICYNKSLSLWDKHGMQSVRHIMRKGL